MNMWRYRYVPKMPVSFAFQLFMNVWVHNGLTREYLRRSSKDANHSIERTTLSSITLKMRRTELSFLNAVL